MSLDLREVPIPETVLVHTGKPDGDDAGYRNVVVCEDDVAGQGDPLVELDSMIAQYAVYAVGAEPGICPAYGRGLGAPSTMLVRGPVRQALLEVDARLRAYDRRVLVLDAYRSVETQRRLWKYLFEQLLGDVQVESLSVLELLKLGIEADNIGSYVTVVKDGHYDDVVDEIMVSNAWADLVEASQALGKDPQETVELFVTFHRNLGYKTRGVSLDTTSNTAHGGGGAIDAIMADLDGKPLNLGVPFDYVGPESAMRYFENPGCYGDFYRACRENAVLHQHAIECGYNGNDFGALCSEIQRNRRLLYHVMMRAGATFYVAECWHWNFGNERGGRQFDRFPHAGSGCHSLLKDVCNPETGEWIAVWGNAWAQRRAAEMLG